VAQVSSPAKWFIVSVIGIAIAIGIYISIEQARSRHARASQAMTAAEKAYLAEIEVTGARMSAASNFLGSTQYYLDGELSNKGGKAIRQLRLNLTFTDPFGDPVFHQTVNLVNSKTAPLKAGETIALHLIFEQLPATWNQGPPAISAGYVKF
jgi:hypothetical protein